MEIFLLILAFLFMLIGIIGCIVPGLPGTPVAYAGLWIAQSLCLIMSSRRGAPSVSVAPNGACGAAL